MIVPILVLMAVIGVPLFAVIAFAALNAYLGAELEPALFIIGFMELGDHAQLLAVPLIFAIAALLGRDYLRGWGSLLTSLVDGLPSGVSLASIVLALIAVPIVACGLVMAMLVPVVLYTVISVAVVPRESIGADELVVAALLPALLMVAAVACLPGLGHRLSTDCGDAHSSTEPFGRLWWDLPVLFIAIAAIACGWLTVKETALVVLVWVLFTRVVAWREMAWKELPERLTGSVVTSAGIVLMLGLMMSCVAMLHDVGVLQTLNRGIGPPIVSLAVLILLLVFGGLVLGIQAGLVLLAPLSIPVGLAIGMAPMHLGVVSMACVLLGRSLLPLARAQWPNGRWGRDVEPDQGLSATWRVLLVPAILFLVMLVALPVLSLWLPNRI